MHSVFQLLCESAPLATLAMIFALIWIRYLKSSATRTHLVVMAVCGISILSPVLITLLPKWRVLPPIMPTENQQVIIKPLNFSATDHFTDIPPKSYPLWFRVASSTWLIGFGLRLMTLIKQRMGLRRILMLGESVSFHIGKLTTELTKRRGIKRKIRWMTHADVESAFTCGIFRPVIVLPSNCEQICHSDLRIMMDHELAHVQRCDAIHGLLFQIFIALWWFHPLAWALYRNAEIIKERACDDLVLLSGEDPQRYAMCLGFAVLRAHHHPPLLNEVSTFARRAPQLVRIQAILDPSIDRSTLTKRETWNVYAPAIFTAMLLSSLGFKVVSELQVNRPAFFVDTPGEKIPNLWTDAMLPLARSIRLPMMEEPLEAVQHHVQSRPQSIVHPSRMPGSENTSSMSLLSIPHARNQQLSSDLSGNRSESRGYLRNEMPKFTFLPKNSANSVRDFFARPTISSGGGLLANVDPSDHHSSFSESGEAASDSDVYGLVEMNDSGVIVYSQVTQSATGESLGRVDDFLVNSQSMATTAFPVSGGTSVIAPSLSPSVEAYHEDGRSISPQDLGIQDIKSFIAPTENGGRLSVSLEVPASSANAWRVEASMDFESWTDSAEVVTHKFSLGSSPGSLRLTASIVSPIPSAHHRYLRLHSKW